MCYQSRGERFREAFKRIFATTSENVWELYRDGRVVKGGWPQYLGDNTAIWIDIVAYRNGILRERTTHFSNVRTTTRKPHASRVIDAYLDVRESLVYVIGDAEEIFVDVPLEEYPNYTSRIKKSRDMMNVLAQLLEA